MRLFVFALLMAWLGVAGAQSFKKMDVNAKIIGGNEVLFSVENSSMEKITLVKSGTPWSDSVLGAEFYAFRGRDGSIPLKKFGALLDNPDQLVISPGELISGKIELKYIFPEIESYSKNEDIYIFWIYSPLDLNGGRLPRSNGMLILKRR